MALVLSGDTHTHKIIRYMKVSRKAKGLHSWFAYSSPLWMENHRIWMFLSPTEHCSRAWKCHFLFAKHHVYATGSFTRCFFVANLFLQYVVPVHFEVQICDLGQQKIQQLTSSYVCSSRNRCWRSWRLSRPWRVVWIHCLEKHGAETKGLPYVFTIWFCI